MVAPGSHKCVKTLGTGVPVCMVAPGVWKHWAQECQCGGPRITQVCKSTRHRSASVVAPGSHKCVRALGTGVPVWWPQDRTSVWKHWAQECQCGGPRIAQVCKSTRHRSASVVAPGSHKCVKALGTGVPVWWPQDRTSVWKHWAQECWCGGPRIAQVCSLLNVLTYCPGYFKYSQQL